MAINQEEIRLDETTAPPSEPADAVAASTIAASAAAAASAYASAANLSSAGISEKTPDAPETPTADEAEPTETAPTMEELRAAVVNLTAQIAEKDDRILRQQAEFQNFRRRTQKEKDDLGQVVTQEIIKSLLPSLDNFERALAAETDDAAVLRKGIEMIYSQFVETLKKHGLKPIAAVGKPFDPHFHQAVMRTKNSELPDSTVARELQRGYMVGEAVIRPSMVAVTSGE